MFIRENLEIIDDWKKKTQITPIVLIRENSSFLLSSGFMFQDPEWMPETRVAPDPTCTAISSCTRDIVYDKV